MALSLPTIACISRTDLDVNGLIRHYFERGFTYLEIKEFIHVHHDVNLSLSTIKRRLKKMGLYKRPLPGKRVDAVTLRSLVLNELQGSGSNLGYRRVWSHLKRKGFLVRREDVRIEIAENDPSGVERRKKRKLKRRKYFSQGPNHTWHIDGHDKLKPYGFCLQGCIDGFSRRIIWMEVASSNKKPELVARYYCDAVKLIGGIPKKLKADDGTEHSIIEPIHITLRDLVGDENAVDSFSIVPSPHNQRIESYWSKLRGDRMGWWQEFFRDMIDLELFDPSDPVLVDCLRFCFMNILRAELKELVEEWNEHIISKSINGGPSGRPDTMYFLPHLFGKENHLDEVEDADIDEFQAAVDDLPRDFSLEFEEFANTVMAPNGMVMAENIRDGLNLYLFLLLKITEFS